VPVARDLYNQLVRDGMMDKSHIIGQCLVCFLVSTAGR
jgi:hypothetical protein